MSSVPKGKNAGSTSPLAPTALAARPWRQQAVLEHGLKRRLCVDAFGCNDVGQNGAERKQDQHDAAGHGGEGLRRNRRHAIDHSLRTAAEAIASMEAVSARGGVVAIGVRMGAVASLSR